jgi:hypothetical protein
MPNEQRPENLSTLPEPPPSEGGELYDNLKKTPAKRLTNSIEKVDGLTPEEEQAAERGGNLALRGTRRKVQRWWCYAYFGFGIAVGVLALVAVVVMVALYISWIYHEGKIESTIGGIIAFVLGSAVTLAVERFLPEKPPPHH